MNIRIAIGETGRTARLTLGGCCDCPILRMRIDGVEREFYPFDLVDLNPPDSDCMDLKIIQQNIVPAGEIVAAWARDPRRTDRELAAAQQYLSVWPGGPQI
jgi:hypothetical protein